MTFTLNRIYVNPYKGKGFDITSTTQFDQKYTHGRNTFESKIQIRMESIFIGSLYKTKSLAKSRKTYYDKKL